jgi:uncharacterized integral membrane protein
MIRFLFRLSLLIAALAAISVTVLNSGEVWVELAFARFESPLGLALVVSFVLGLVAGLSWQMVWISRLLEERSRLRRALRVADAKADTSVPVHFQTNALK